MFSLKHHPHPVLSLRERGFTLIELLVVIVIIGVILAIATLSVGVLGRDTEVEDETRRLFAVLTQAREESELQGRDFGVLIEKDGYLFMQLDHRSKSWLVPANDELLTYRALPDGLQFKLWLDSREVILKPHQENQKLLEAAAESAASSSSSSAPVSPVSTVERGVRPQIAVLSSGDITPFELRLARDDNPFYWRLLGGADNSLNLEPSTATR